MRRQYIKLFFVRPTAGFVTLPEPAIDGLLRQPSDLPAQATPASPPASTSTAAQCPTQSTTLATDAPLAFARSAVWAPATAGHVLVVEALVCAAVMAYFAYGLAATFGLT